MTRAAARVQRRPTTAPRRPRVSGGAERVVRVNARLDAATAAILRQLVRETGLSVTDVIKLSLTRLSDQQSGPEHTVTEVFGDLIGCFEGTPALSESYKQELAASIARKHDAP